MGHPLSDAQKLLFSLEAPFTTDEIAEEESKANSFDQLSSALSATSTSMISLEDTCCSTNDVDFFINVPSKWTVKKSTADTDDQASSSANQPVFVNHHSASKSQVEPGRLTILAKPIANHLPTAASESDSHRELQEDIERSIMKDNSKMKKKLNKRARKRRREQ